MHILTVNWTKHFVSSTCNMHATMLTEYFKSSIIKLRKLLCESGLLAASMLSSDVTHSMAAGESGSSSPGHKMSTQNTEQNSTPSDVTRLSDWRGHRQGTSWKRTGSRWAWPVRTMRTCKHILCIHCKTPLSTIHPVHKIHSLVAHYSAEHEDIVVELQHRHL